MADKYQDPRDAEKDSSKAPNDDPNVARSPYEPNDSTTGSEPETPGAGTEERVSSDDESPKADGNATRQPGGTKEPHTPGEETAPLDRG